MRGAGMQMIRVQRGAPARKTLRGSCLCGDIAFEIASEPARMVNCHCTRCRRARGAAYGTKLLADAERFRWIRGGALVGRYASAVAPALSSAFCPRCGSDMPQYDREAAAVVVPAGTLDDDPGLRPSAHVFVGTQPDWLEITDDLPLFVRCPPLTLLTAD